MTSPKSASDWLQIANQHFEIDKDVGDGTWLEELVCAIGHKVPEWGFESVVPYQHWPEREEVMGDAGLLDIGIDLVGIRPNRKYVCIQCKAHSDPDKAITGSELKQFNNTRVQKWWDERWVVSNAKFSGPVIKMNVGDSPLKLVDSLAPLRQIVVDEGGEYRDDPNLTTMQDEAVSRIVYGLKKHAKETKREAWNQGEARGRVIMPCGTGKTRVAFRVMQRLVQIGEIAVVLVPSIALVSQLKREFHRMAHQNSMYIRTLAVCSDRSAGRASIYDEGEGFIEVVGNTATNEDAVVDWLTEGDIYPNAINIIFSTYQSSHNTAGGLTRKAKTAKLLICDEAHRTAGIKKIKLEEREKVRRFLLCHDSKKLPATYRIYQTATPKVYNERKNAELYAADDWAWDVRSMDDQRTFGVELYRLTYREAVERDLLSDYRIVAWGIDQTAGEDFRNLVESSTTKEGETVQWDAATSLRALTLALFLGGASREKGKKPINIKSVISFVNRVKTSKDMARVLNSEPIEKWLVQYFKEARYKRKPRPFHATHVDATFVSAKRDTALHKLGAATLDTPFCISNVGIFGEGTDSPDLSAIAFLEPRKSAVEVVQAVGRAMRKSKDKSVGYILVPFVIPENHDAEDFLMWSDAKHGWNELGQILQALRAHDSRIEDDLSELIEFYVPASPSPKKELKHLIVVHDSLHNEDGVFLLSARRNRISNWVAPKDENDGRAISSRLKAKRGKVQVITDPQWIAEPPHTISVVRTTKNGDVYVQNRTYDMQIYAMEGGPEWDPQEIVETAQEYIREDQAASKSSMHKVRSGEDEEPSVVSGSSYLPPEWKTLLEFGEAGKAIQANLLEQSGIQAGPRRDMNILRSTVVAVANMLRDGGYSDLLDAKLNMENLSESELGNADSATVTAVIWTNAAVMHARLEQEKLPQLAGVPSLQSCVAEPNPAVGIVQAWTNVLSKDYTPIFKIAIDLMHSVAFKGEISIYDALHRLARDAVDIGNRYASLGMDHAGELFNKVMGNQKSDGAFFTRPIAATMLAELSIEARINSHTSMVNDSWWLDEGNWDSLRVFDPACGSGTLLVAMLDSIKQRIAKAGGSLELIRKFHRRAVEDFITGADINPTSLQLAGCQLTLGDPSISYESINLHNMRYGLIQSGYDGVEGIAPTPENTRVGTVELLNDERIVPTQNELGIHHDANEGAKLDLFTGSEKTDLADRLHEKPPSFVIMNPPYTPYRDIGTKFTTDIQKGMRERLKRLWEQKSRDLAVLRNKKTVIAILFEALALELTRENKGVLSMVRAGAMLVAANSLALRRDLATSVHVDFILTCYEPRNMNMSWDTNINEYLIVASAVKSDRPTRFINLHKFPETPEEAREQLQQAIADEPFNGSTMEWDYKRMEEGDWSPAIFSDCAMAAQFLSLELHKNRKLRCDIVSDLPPPPPPTPSRQAKDVRSPTHHRRNFKVSYQTVLLTSQL